MIQLIASHCPELMNNPILCDKSTRAFARLELLVMLAILTLLASMLLPMLAYANKKSARIRCANNLKQIGIAFRLFATAHADGYPMELSTNAGGSKEYVGLVNETYRHFQVMSNELTTPKILVCPSDNRSPATSLTALTDTNISYFVGLGADETQPARLLAGDRNLKVNGVIVKGVMVPVQSNDSLGWTKAMHGSSGNIALTDGSVQSVTANRLREVLRNRSTIRLVFPR